MIIKLYQKLSNLINNFWLYYITNRYYQMVIAVVRLGRCSPHPWHLLLLVLLVLLYTSTYHLRFALIILDFSYADSTSEFVIENLRLPSCDVTCVNQWNHIKLYQMLYSSWNDLIGWRKLRLRKLCLALLVLIDEVDQLALVVQVGY